MATDGLDWVAREIDLPTLVLQDGVVVERSAAARRLIGEGFIGEHGELASALSAITGARCEPELATRVAELPAGKHRGTLGGYDLLARREGERVRVVCVPTTVRNANAERQRWAASDLAAGVAHELSNALGAILGWVQLARRKSELPPPAERALTLIETSARAAHETARHMLETARGTVVGAQMRVDVSVLVREVVELLGPAADDSSVHVEESTQDDLWVEGSRAQLFTVVWNLVQNAIEATAREGTVVVSATRDDHDVVITVSDDGPGIAESERERVFEPYYTTKETGTGLGLPLVRRAVEALTGTIHVEAARSGGARFVVQLPVAEHKTGRSSDSAPDGLDRRSGVIQRGSTKGARILVVEDDRSMRELMATALELAGAEVVTCGSGEEALAVEGEFDLALVDLGLGDLRGDAVLAELRRTGRATVAALVSGSSVPPIPSSEGRPDAWLRKPFELDDLLATVKQLLSRLVLADAASE